MGAFDALRNLAIFLFIMNIFAVLAATIFPDFGTTMLYGNVEQLTNNMQEQVNALNIDSSSTIGNVISAWGLTKTFFMNMLTGNYYIWRAIGLDRGFSITSTGVNVKTGGFTLAVVFGILGEMVYVLGTLEFIRGRV